jgi:hypothetical protein
MAIDFPLVPQIPFKMTLPANAQVIDNMVVVDLSTVAAGSLAIANNLSELTATADTALGNLGATAVGIDLLQAADESAARAVLGSTTVGDAVFIAASTSAAQSAIGASATGRLLFIAASATAARTTLLTNVQWFPVSCYVAATTAGKTYIPIPADFSGTIDSILAATSGDPGATLTFAPAIGPSGGPFVAITGGGFTVANAATAGTKSTASPSAAKTVTGGTSVVEIAWDNVAANAINVTVMIGVTRTA